MTTPYSDQPGKAFWRSAVADRSPFDIRDLWAPRFSIKPDMPVVTFGSCFAQHFSKALVDRGYAWTDMEPAPACAPSQIAQAYNYGVFSARTGNIYTAAALRQWLTWAFNEAEPPEELWESGGRWFDPFRPAIEPNGFASAEELRQSRAVTLEALRKAVVEANRFVFTMGLTESWINREQGYVYAGCPGAAAGSFDASRHTFLNQSPSAVLSDMRQVVRLLKRYNVRSKVLLTVSPVPLTATATDQHVVVATSYSKAVLRTVAGQLLEEMDRIDYFPSYEIIASPVFQGMFYAPNKREVVSAGVNFVMQSFFDGMNARFPVKGRAPATTKAAGVADIVCEEALLEAFGR